MRPDVEPFEERVKGLNKEYSDMMVKEFYTRLPYSAEEQCSLKKVFCIEHLASPEAIEEKQNVVVEEEVKEEVEEVKEEEMEEEVEEEAGDVSSEASS